MAKSYKAHSNRNLTFAYVDPEFAAPNSTFDIEILGNRCRAKVLTKPVYDPRNERLQA